MTPEEYLNRIDELFPEKEPWESNIFESLL